MNMKTFLRGLALAAACVLLLSGCPFSVSAPSGMAEVSEIQHLPYSGSFTYTMDSGDTAKDVYFVFTNLNTESNSAVAPTVSADSITVDGKTLQAPAAQRLGALNSNPTTLGARIAEFNRNPSTYISKTKLPRPSGGYIANTPASSDDDGVMSGTSGIPSTGTFYTGMNYYTGAGEDEVPATCRKVVSATLGDGTTRTLSIWVADDYWIGDVDVAEVDALASRFLQSSGTSDIYHWDTSVIGEPWGTPSSSDYIPWDSKKTVTILLTQLNSSYASGSVMVGYFWAKDNYSATYLPASNERIMFYIDSRLYGFELVGGEGSWAETNYWPKIVFSTLAHEFQHMIQFYQKQVVFNLSSSTDTWINEMCSMIMEDLVADKLEVEGPRGVSYLDKTAGSSGNSDGRIPYFNAYSSRVLTIIGTPYVLEDYSTSYAFGAWLARNYGGAELLKNIVQCKETDSSAVVNAAAAASGKTESMQRLLEKWAAAVLLSDTTTAPAGYRYNTGDWTTSKENNITYKLGSINIFNYSPTLAVYSSKSQMSSSSYSSNLYYKAASQVSGPQTFSITLPAGIAMSAVLK